MKVKNISGALLTFNAGKRTYSIANNITVTVDDTIEALNSVVTHVNKHRLEVVSIPPVAQYSGTPERYGYAAINLDSTVADTHTLTIGGVVFEIDEAADGVTGTNTAITAADATDNSVTAAGLKAAINANATLGAIGVVADDIVTVTADNVNLVVEARGSTAIADVAISQTGNGFAITKVNASEGNGLRTSTVVHTATASTTLVNTGLDSITGVASISVRTAAGVVKLWDGAHQIGGGFVHLDSSGTVNTANTDVITLVAIGK